MTTAPRGVGDYDTEFTVRVAGDVKVWARTREEAMAFASGLTPECFQIEKIQVKNRDWRPTAQRLLDAGLSHNEIAKSLGLSRPTISHAFPGTGHTKQMAVDYRNMKAQLQELEEKGLIP